MNMDKSEMIFFSNLQKKLEETDELQQEEMMKKRKKHNFYTIKSATNSLATTSLVFSKECIFLASK